MGVHETGIVVQLWLVLLVGVVRVKLEAVKWV